jgi:hypothetical protein
MSSKRSEETQSSSEPSRCPITTACQAPKAHGEGHQPREPSDSPKSPSSSSLSPPLYSDDLDDPFSSEATAPERGNLKITIQERGSSEYEAPTTRTTAKCQSPYKRRKVHFQDAETNEDSTPTKPGVQKIVFLEGLDAPFKLTKKSIFAKSGCSKKQKAWSREPLAAQERRIEAINSREAENLKAALGPDLEGSRASTPASFVSNTPSKRGRGNGRRGRGRGGRGGRGRGGGRAGRNEDSPEPPKKRIMTDAEKEIIADLKARQAELKKFFKEVGAQQNEALSLLATRDLMKIAKKSRAHEKVPKYQVLLDALEERKKEAEDFARGKHEYALQQAKILLGAQKEIIEQRYNVSASRFLPVHSVY